MALVDASYKFIYVDQAWGEVLLKVLEYIPSTL